MSQRAKFILKILNGSNDNDIVFFEMCNLLLYLGFSSRIKGSHHIFYKDGIEEIINIQSKNGNVKAYQVKHIRDIIIKYKLGGNFDV